MADNDKFPFFVHTNQMIISFIFLTVLLALSITSFIVLHKKRETANLRGQTLLIMMILMHCLSLGYPNILTILAFFNKYYFLNFSYLNLSIDIFAIIMITTLIFIRALFMYKKAKNEIISNLRGVILTVALFVGSTFIFYVITFKPNFPVPPFQVLQIIRGNLYFSAIDSKSITIILFFYVSFLLVQNLHKWGVYYEMGIILAIKLTSMLVTGIIQNNKTGFFWIIELQENIFRALLMTANCFFFILFFDEMNKECEINTNMDILKASHWDNVLVKCFMNFLKKKKEEEMFSFFKREIKNNKNVWKLLQNLQGMLKKKIRK